MFRRKVQSMQTLLPDFLRRQGLESPLRQRRLLTSWDDVVGEPIARYTSERFIKNQTLFVKVNNPALRADLGGRRSIIKKRLNECAGAQVIVDIKFY